MSSYVQAAMHQGRGRTELGGEREGAVGMEVTKTNVPTATEWLAALKNLSLALGSREMYGCTGLD